MLKDDLRDLIAKRQVIALVGTGVSQSASGKHSVASWAGLLSDGVQRCMSVAQPLPAGWDARLLAEIGSGDLDDLLSAAEKIAAKLGAPKGGEFRRWLRETVGQLPLVDRSVPDALQKLGVPLITTNYDSLLEQASGLRPVTWRDGAQVERVLRGDEQSIIHLHGHWEDPESVILGIRSYDQILRDEHAQNMMRAMRSYKSLLYIGYGDGLRDPNFGPFLKWSRNLFADSEYRHFRLSLDKDVPSLQKQHPPEERLYVLSYGARHDDLGHYLLSLK